MATDLQGPSPFVSILIHSDFCAQALQLLEYLIKNGSERVVDDARSHISTIKMLRNFYYIDDKGKDHHSPSSTCTLHYTTTSLTH